MKHTQFGWRQSNTTRGRVITVAATARLGERREATLAFPLACRFLQVGGEGFEGFRKIAQLEADVADAAAGFRFDFD